MTPMDWIITIAIIYLAIGVVGAFFMGYALTEIDRPGGGYWGPLDVTPPAIVLGVFWPLVLVGAFVWGVAWLFVNREIFWPAKQT